jgi:hypothetical protein
VAYELQHILALFQASNCTLSQTRFEICGILFSLYSPAAMALKLTLLGVTLRIIWRRSFRAIWQGCVRRQRLEMNLATANLFG